MLAYLKKHGDLFITLSAIAGGLAILITINGNRFNAQDNLIAQRLDAQERFMNQRFEAQERFMNQRFEAQEKLMNQRFEQVNQPLRSSRKAHRRSRRAASTASPTRLPSLRRIMVGIGRARVPQRRRNRRHPGAPAHRRHPLTLDQP